MISSVNLGFEICDIKKPDVVSDTHTEILYGPTT